MHWSEHFDSGQLDEFHGITFLAGPAIHKSCTSCELYVPLFIHKMLWLTYHNMRIYWWPVHSQR